MITDLRDLEPLLSQYDSGLILVGPVLSLSKGGHRYFYIAANGSKVFEPISLGYSEDEADSENQRENITAILKSRFREMLTFDSHTEMAQAANTHWPNEETARVLALATLLAEPQPDAAAEAESFEDKTEGHEIASDHGQQPVADIAREPVDQDTEAAPKGGLPWTSEETWPEQSHEPPNPPAIAQNPSGRADGPAATLQQKPSGRNDADIASITRALRPSRQSQNGPRQPALTPSPSRSGERVVGEQRRSERSGDLLAIMASFTRPDLDQADIAAIAKAMEPPDQPPSHSSWFSVDGARNLAAVALLMLVVGGASAWFTRAMVRSDRWRAPHDVVTTTPKPAAATASSATPVQQTASAEPTKVEAGQRATTNEPIQRDGSAALAARTSSPPARQPSEGASAQDKIVPATRSGQQAMANGPPGRIAPAPLPPIVPPAPLQPYGATSTTKPVPASRPEQAATNEPTRQVEPAPAAMVPPSPPSLLAGGASIQAKPAPTSRSEQQAEANEPTHPIEPAAAAAASSRMAPQPSGGASPQANVAPDSGSERQVIASVPGAQPTPVLGGSAVSPVDSQVNIALIERGTAFLKRGDLASARLLLRRAADAGSAEAALMLGSTFDPLTIQQLDVIGVEPDVARARQWYQKAAELGSDVAAQRLAKLNNQ